jgi:hypothetical protein
MGRGGPTFVSRDRETLMLRSVPPFLLVVLLLCPASVIHAAPLVDISWTVSGGQFSGLSNGAVTGGTVRFTPFFPITTPFVTHFPGVWSLSLTQSFGAASFKATWNAGALVLTGVAFQAPSNPGTFSNVTTVSTHGFNLALVTDLVAGMGPFSPIGGSGFVSGEHSIATFAHTFTVAAGSEVRTFVPEPTTGSLIGLGLVIMGVVGGGRRAAHRARRA